MYLGQLEKAVIAGPASKDRGVAAPVQVEMPGLGCRLKDDLAANVHLSPIPRHNAKTFKCLLDCIVRVRVKNQVVNGDLENLGDLLAR